MDETMANVKTSRDSELLGQKGVNLIEKLVLGMGLLWHPAGPFDYGIDGRIELRDVRTKRPLNRQLGVQSKARARFTAETEDRFEFLCERADIDYWMRSDVPVILVCSHPDESRAWFCCVTDWFVDKKRRAERRIAFDKRADRFDPSRAMDLFRLAERREPTLHRLSPPPPEQLLTNFLPILEHGSQIWCAPCEIDSPEQAHALYNAASGPRSSDYLLRSGNLYSFSNPRKSPLGVLCEASKASAIDAADWSQADDPVLRRQWVELLRRTLLHQFKRQFQWQPSRRLFYVPAAEGPGAVSVEGPNGPRQVVKVARYFDKRLEEERIQYVRHHAFRPGFRDVDGHWHLEIEPDYYFTRDGERESRKADQYLAGIKRLDRNLAVIGHLKMWAYLLTRPRSLMDQEAAHLIFGELKEVSVPVGIDDARWREKRDERPDVMPGQEELAA
jgi:hypothetical protein